MNTWKVLWWLLIPLSLTLSTISTEVSLEYGIVAAVLGVTLPVLWVWITTRRYCPFVSEKESA